MIFLLDLCLKFDAILRPEEFLSDTFSQKSKWKHEKAIKDTFWNGQILRNEFN